MFPRAICAPILAVAAGCMACTVPIASAVFSAGGSTGVTVENVVVHGVLTDNAQQPVSGATIAVPPATMGTTTGADGSFTLMAGTISSRLVFTVAASGYAPLTAAIDMKQGQSLYNWKLIASPFQTTSMSAAAGGSFTVLLSGRMATFSVPPGAIDTSGQVQLRVGAYDPATGPGRLATDATNGYGGLQSAGMFYIDAFNSSGQLVSAFGGGGVTLSIPPFSPTAIPNVEGMQVWRLLADGQWGNAIPTSAAPAGITFSMAQPGFWNAARSFRTACVRGRLQAQGLACSGAQVQATGPADVSSYDGSGADGSFCVPGTPAWMSSLTVGFTAQSIQMPSSAGSCSVLSSCQDLGTIAVDSAACASLHGGDGG